MIGRAVSNVIIGIVYAFFVEMVAYIVISIVAFFIAPSLNPSMKVCLGVPTAIVEQAWGLLIAQIIAYGALLVFSWETSKIKGVAGSIKREMVVLGVVTTISVAILGYMVDVAPPGILEYIRALIGVSIISGFIGGIAGTLARSL